LRVFIGDRTCEPATAWEGRDVSEYAMSAAGVDASAVESLAASMEELDAVIWSGGGGTLERERLLSAVDEAIGGGL